MSNDYNPTEKPFEFPMMPIYGVDLGRELGSLDARLNQLDTRMNRLETRIDNLDAKTDKMAYAINRLDERTKAMQSQIMVIGGGILVAVIAGIILQFLLK